MEILYKTILKIDSDKAFDKIKEDLKEILKELGDYISEIAEEGGEALTRIAKEIIEWIRARDPVRKSTT